nr:hypothetical protein [uncultured Draconibacterium sp.]
MAENIICYWFFLLSSNLSVVAEVKTFFSSMRPTFTGTTRFIAFKTPNVKTLTVGRNAQGLWIDSEQLIPISILQELIELKDEIATILSILTGDVLLFTLELHR